MVSSWANIDTEGADAAAGVAAAGGVANPVPGINEVKPSAMLTVLATMVRRRVADTRTAEGGEQSAGKP